MNPEELRYTDRHEWVRLDGTRATIGITQYAQDQLGDVVFVDLPPVGTEVAPEENCGEVESTKSVSDLFSPVEGTVVERNDDLESTPELVNSDPYGEGWMIVVEVADPSAVDALLDAAEYTKLTE